MPREPMGPVIAGVDGPSSAAAVDLAAQESAAHSVPLVLVHAMEADASGALDAALAQVRRTHPGCTVTAELAAGDPADALVSRSAGASMVVLGHGRRNGRSRRASVALRVLSRARTPVIVYRRLCSGTHEATALPVLVGIDGTPGSEAAVAFGFAEAALHGAPLHAVHMWPHDTDRTEAEGAFLDLLESWSDKYPEVPVRLTVRHGLDAAIVLAAASRSARLAVVPTDHPVGAHRVPPGSALGAFIDRASCPVAVVPRGG